MPIVRAALVASAVVLSAICAVAAGSAQTADGQIVPSTLESPAKTDSAQPQLTVSKRGVLLSWIERTGPEATLKFSERTADGWTAPTVVAAGRDWFVNWADVPSVVRLEDGTVVAHWLQKSGPDTYAYDVRLSHSRDGGKTWSSPIKPHSDGTKTEHGFATLFQMPGAGLGLVWLDGRDQELNTTDPLGGSMALYYASFDSSWKQTAESVVNARVCECCQTAAVLTADGVVTAFRDRSADEIRDIKVSRLDAGKWTPELALHDDNWKIDACPINGPALSARGRQVAAAWFAAPNDNGRAFVAFSQDAGKTWGQAVRLDDEASLGRVDIEMLDDGSAIASWIEFAGGKSQFKVRHITSSGQKSAAVDVPGAGRVSGYPRMTRAGNELILAWTEGESGQQVKAAVARLK